MKPSCVSVLPKLPVPKLSETLEKYLLCIKAIVPEPQFDRTQSIVREFGKTGGLGEKLQKELEKYAEREENWAYSWWLKDMYLENRAALPVNSNPGMVLPRQTFSNRYQWLLFAAEISVGIMEFKLVLDARALPMEMASGQLAGQALCMEQYYKLLRSHRLPGKDCDRLVTMTTEPRNENSYIIVAYKNEFFVVNIGIGASQVSVDHVTLQLINIVESMDKKELPSCQVGILTSENRDVWAKARLMLLEEEANRTSIDLLERSVFVLCLDSSVKRKADHDLTLAAHQMLHGCGCKNNAANRWYDKTLQMIVCEDGNIGLTYEHSVSEGIAVKSLVENLLNNIKDDTMNVENEKKIRKNCKKIQCKKYLPVHLKWKIDNRVKRYIEAAKVHSEELYKQVDMKIFDFDLYGKNYIKQQNMSPDAFVQVALQLTYYKIYGHLVSTYESASLRRFRHGRVDNIRAATVHVLELAKTLYQENTGENSILRLDARKMNLLRRAVKAQTDNTKSCITGNGFDNHLIALHRISQELGITKPEIFEDTSFSRSNYFTLSTSQIPTTTNSFMCYGAVVPDGYGVSYNPKKDNIVFCIGSFRDCIATDSTKFSEHLYQSLSLMKELTLKWNRLRRSSSLELLKNIRKMSLHWPEIATSLPPEKKLREPESGKDGQKKLRIMQKRKTFNNLPIRRFNFSFLQ